MHRRRCSTLRGMRVGAVAARRAILVLCALLIPSGVAPARPRAAATVLLNGRVLVFHGVEVRGGRGWPAGGAADFGSRGASEETSARGDAPEFTEALAIDAGKIVFVGTTKKARAYVGPETKVIDLGGRMTMPGIVDGHFHGTRMTDCHLEYEGGTIDRILARLQACLDRPDQAAFRGTNTRFEANYLFGEAIEPKGARLTARDLDRLDTTRPIMVENADGHKFWMNSRAMANAGISKEMRVPPGAAVGRDADGSPDGFFSDFDVSGWGEERTVTEAMRLYRVARTNADASKVGITSVYIPGGGEEEIAQWAVLQDQGKMTVRADIGLSASFVRGNSDAADLRRRIDALAEYRKYARGMIAVDSVKVYCDGVMEYPAQTAAMLVPYRVNTGTSERPEWRNGTSRGPDPSCADARAGFVALDKAGWQIHVHAIGDRAVRDALDNFQAAREANGSRDLRHTITHLQTIDPADIPRFGRLGIVASMSLHWARRDAYSVNFTEGYIPDDLYNHMYPAAGLWRTGAVVAGGSDYPVDPLRPFVQIETAITRTGEEMPGVYPGPLAPREAIPDLLAALKMHTINAAYEMHRETATGSIEVGKDADLIVLDQDLLRIPPARISDTRILLTMVGGRIVYDAGEVGAANSPSSPPAAPQPR